MSTVANTLLDALNWRYAVKAFDPDRKIPAETWEVLQQALILTPSSYGLQPWKIIQVESPELRSQLREQSFNQGQVTDASHLIVFLARTSLTEAEVDRLIELTATTRSVAAEKLAGYRQMMIGDLVQGPRQAVIQYWAANQAYIALGNFLTAAALLGVDTCPLEGIIPTAYDEILQVKDSGYQTVVAAVAGYRSASDGYADLAKVRYPATELLETR
ncbi:NAD(P)H-dependent oxidoreductase [Synechococcus elongatus]|uniref:Nitroreductase n=2 Tax=Synechococcus elongatus TaxID=32046 RepID=Q31MN0_SYNE7|nr:NAD(P)H-dependent oxidoreductase [Synechococcus elongatus]ABB57689.1 nitroreductase [Synechococcus elongatus PCC 7942 = FACHB-805]AJD57820.1 nitroreductase [Synechococcus elongatus UTEX 2973]MBD2586404.1 NAD(P)H-dependent oxidoreductase [Synechococcus elongatus FACHB-242]MBD2687478.1 NAD(P)H-dependent oxidoreductase [Synechococcus elongatus FACHB-1061]MBD2706813.1 NAD(P)H-dependent oxidoreductase [Synechococcus elongatus PCC 7942 = FACHB-805]